jgi:hypothetical protein
MNMRAVLAVASSLLVAVPVPSHSQDYDFTFSGTGTSLSATCPPFQTCATAFPFYGTVQVETAHAGDGFFGGADLIAVTFSWSAFGSPISTFRAPGVPDPFPPLSGATATVLNGEVVDIQASYPYGNNGLGGPGSVGVYGMTAFYSQASHLGRDQASAPLIPAIPEPSAVWLLLAGLMGGLPMVSAARKRG